MKDTHKGAIFGGAIPEEVLTMGEWNNSNLKFFARYDGPFVNRQVAICNHALRKIMKKNFEYMSRNIFFISAFGRFLLGSEKIDQVLQAEQIADSTIQNAINSVQRRIAHATAILTAEQIEESAQNGRVQTMLVPLTSPGARKYIELLVLADSFYNINAVLWINGHIDDQNKFQNESVVRKEVQSAVRGIANQFGFILNLTRRKDPTEAQKVGDHDEEALAADAEKQVGELGQTAVTDSVSKVVPESPVGSDPASAEEKPAKAKKAGSKAARAEVV